MSHLENKVEKLEAVCPVRDRLVVRIVGDADYDEKYAEAEHQAKEQSKDLLVIHRRMVSPGIAAWEVT